MAKTEKTGASGVRRAGAFDGGNAGAALRLSRAFADDETPAEKLERLRKRKLQRCTTKLRPARKMNRTHSRQSCIISSFPTR